MSKEADREHPANTRKVKKVTYSIGASNSRAQVVGISEIMLVERNADDDRGEARKDHAHEGEKLHAENLSETSMRAERLADVWCRCDGTRRKEGRDRRGGGEVNVNAVKRPRLSNQGRSLRTALVCRANCEASCPPSRCRERAEG